MVRSMVTLRPLALTDAPAIAEAVDRSRGALRRWMAWYDDRYDVHTARAWIETSLAAAAAGRSAHFVILANSESLVGVIGLEDISDQTGRAMLGYWVATPAAGRGIGRQAISLILDWARIHTTVRLVWAVVAEVNSGSRRVLELNRFCLVASRGIDERGDTALLYERQLSSGAA